MTAYAPYPCIDIPADGDCPATPSYPSRECTSGCAFWASQYTGKPWPEGWGNADDWPSAARAAKFDVDLTPTPNSVMCIPPNANGAGPKGHVAYVTGPVVNDKVSVIEMNFLIEHGFDFRNARIHGCEFIHLTPKPVPIPQPEEDDMKPVLVSTPTSGIWLLWGAAYYQLDQPAEEFWAAQPGIVRESASEAQHQFYRNGSVGANHPSG